MSSPLRRSLGSALRQFRKKKRMNRDRAGSLLGVSGNYVTNIETGTGVSIDRQIAAMVSLGMTPTLICRAVRSGLRA